MRRVVVSFSIIFFFISACSDGSKVPDNIIPPGKMQQIVWDVLQADELALQRKVADSTVRLKDESFHLYEQVFAIHKTTRAKFYSSYRYYQAHPDLYKTLMDLVKKTGERERKAIQASGH